MPSRRKNTLNRGSHPHQLAILAIAPIEHRPDRQGIGALKRQRNCTEIERLTKIACSRMSVIDLAMKFSKRLETSLMVAGTIEKLARQVRRSGRDGNPLRGRPQPLGNCAEGRELCYRSKAFPKGNCRRGSGARSSVQAGQNAAVLGSAITPATNATDHWREFLGRKVRAPTDLPASYKVAPDIRHNCGSWVPSVWL
jgi:hypothetical protein